MERQLEEHPRVVTVIVVNEPGGREGSFCPRTHQEVRSVAAQSDCGLLPGGLCVWGEGGDSLARGHRG